MADLTSHKKIKCYWKQTEFKNLIVFYFKNLIWTHYRQM